MWNCRTSTNRTRGTVLPDHHDATGISGATTERPASKGLTEDIEARKVVHMTRREFLEVVHDRLEGHPAAVEHDHPMCIEMEGSDVETVPPTVDVDP
jgi:hypothetical protein